jgi:hypothetical protein
LQVLHSGRTPAIQSERLALKSVGRFVFKEKTMFQNFVELPGELQGAIIALSVFAVGWLFAQIGARLPWFLKLFGQYADEVAMAVAGALIGVIQNALNLIPPGWEAVGSMALALIVAVLAAIGLFRSLGKAGVRSFR